MNARKRLVLTVLCTLGSFCGTSAHAGIPVIDAANLMQSIQQVIAWAQQYQQMAQQYQQQVQQYQSVTGVRNLGDILNNPALRNVVDPNFLNMMQSIQTMGQGGLSGAAQVIRNASLIYNCADRVGENRRTCESFLSLNAQTMANQQNALNLMTQRIGQIQGLQSRINTTGDPKAIAELQARISAEQAQIANDANRVAVMQAYAEAQDRAMQQQIKERELRSLSLPNDGTSTFVYTR